MASNKIGRPTDSPKNTMLRVRLDENTVGRIDNLAESSDSNRSVVIRQSIPTILSSEKFNNMLSMNTLYELEKYSKACHDFFDTLTEDIEESNIKANFPAFLSDEGNRHVLYVKHPTYRIGVPDKRFMFSYSELEDIIRKSGHMVNDYFIYLQPNRFIVINTANRRPVEDLPCISEILCLRETLHDNELLAKELTSIFSEKSIRCEIWPGYYLVPKNVVVTVIDNKQYIRIIK